MEALCYIAGAGGCSGMSIERGEHDMVIAADGGYASLEAAGIVPDIAVGDFDSLGFVPAGVEVLRHPPEKDDTDMMLAICKGLELGYSRFLIYGGLGGRFDHSMANIQSLCYLSRRGARGWLWGDGTAATAVTGGRIDFPGKCRGMFSVFSLGGRAEGVCESGSEYTLDGDALDFGYPLAVSNEFTGAPVCISAERGTLAVIWTCSAAELEQMIRDGHC